MKKKKRKVKLFLKAKYYPLPGKSQFGEMDVEQSRPIETNLKDYDPDQDLVQDLDLVEYFPASTNRPQLTNPHLPNGHNILQRNYKIVSVVLKVIDVARLSRHGQMANCSISEYGNLISQFQWFNRRH